MRNKILNIITIFSFVFFTKSLLAINMECKFEEIYSNGQVQQGFFLLSDKNFRYQYSDYNLFTVLYDSKNFFLIKNNDRKNEQMLNPKETEIFSIMIELSNKYPNIQDHIKIDEFEISLEKSKIHSFYKRISIISDNLNMSIFFNDCDPGPINNIFFYRNPVIEYYPK